jgi:hypothetical protein
MPTIEELKGLLTYPLLTTTRTLNQLLNQKQLHIDATYFPNTNYQLFWFWSSTPSAGYRYYAWYVDFDNGYSGSYDKDDSAGVRLVRG